jgi:hypothetical protein
VRPGVNISITDAPPAESLPTDASTWFVSGLTEKGSTSEPILVRSLNEYITKCGGRVSYGYLYDSIDVFFREGGSQAYISRVTGPTDVSASFMLQDSGPANTLKVEAINEGEWGNSLNVQVVAGSVGGTFVLVISHDTLGELERSPDLVDKQAALDWATGSSWIKLTDQASVNDPAVGGPFNLASGTDDRTNILDAHWTSSLTRFNRDLGPGQVSFPGRTLTTGHTALQAHAADNNRVAILDFADTNVKATILAAITAVRNSDSKWSGVFGHWVKCPGITPGTLRTIPPSALVCGLIGKVVGTANTPAAGDAGMAVYCTDLTMAQLSDPDIQELNAKGYNSIIKRNGRVMVFGWRSLAHPDTEENWINLGNVRLVTEIAGEADLIGESFLFDEIDGQGHKISQFGGALTGMLMPYWSAGSLYGATQDKAFVVDVGPSVNTPQSIENLELKAHISVRMSPFAEMITIEIVKTRINE